MIKLKTLRISTNNKTKAYPLDRGPISLRGDANLGKSSFISLFYLLLGSKTTLTGKNSFQIYLDKKYGIEQGDKFSLDFLSDDTLFTHEIRIKSDGDDKSLSFYINNKEAKINNFKANYVSLSDEISIADFQKGGTPSKFTRYNIDSFFRAFQDGGSIFTPSSKTESINSKIRSILFGDSSELMSSMEKRELLYIDQKKLSKQEFEFNKLTQEKREIKQDIKTFTSEEKSDINSAADYYNINSSVKKMSDISIKMMMLSSTITSLEASSVDNSTYGKYFKMINKLKFKNEDLKIEFNNYLTSKLKNTISSRKSIALMKKELDNLSNKYEEIDDKLRREKTLGKKADKLRYYYLREKYLDENINIKKFDKNELDNINKKIEKLTESINKLSNKNSFIAKANDILRSWDASSGNYEQINNEFKLTRESEGSNTTSLLMDKIIAFIVAMENAMTTLKDSELMPSLITVDKMTSDMTKNDLDNVSHIMDNFSSTLVDLSKEGITIIVQDKHNQLNNDDILIIDFNKENPFNFKKI